MAEKLIFRRKNPNGEYSIYERCVNPAFILDLNDGHIYQYGEFKNLQKQLSLYAPIGGVLVEGPRDQHTLDRIFQNQIYFLQYYNPILKQSAVSIVKQNLPHLVNYKQSKYLLS